jgi:UDPglucose--hexose-1-phosphate uridylyltransferase
MSEMRFNSITRDWVVIAPGRSQKPNDFRADTKEHAARPSHVATCPFCTGHEEADEICRVAAPDGGWRVRVVPNKFPALTHHDDLQRATRGTFRSMSAAGAHEVVIEHPRHDLSLADMGVEHLALLLRIYRDRYAALRQDPAVESITIFKNHGQRAGASLGHPHSQIVAAPVISSNVRMRFEEASRAFDEAGECLYCRVLADEIAAGERIFESNSDFTAFVPYAALSPFHTWIFPHRHASSFDSITDEEIAALAQILHRVLRRLSVAASDPDFNFSIRSAPISACESPYFHWVFAIVARVNYLAGFELGSGIYINGLCPEEAAARLRAAVIES